MYGKSLKSIQATGAALAIVLLSGIASPTITRAECVAHAITDVPGHWVLDTLMVQVEEWNFPCVGAAAAPTYCEGPWTIADAAWGEFVGVEVYLRLPDEPADAEWYKLWRDAAGTDPLLHENEGDLRTGCAAMDILEGHATCGDGATEVLEECDDGATEDGDCCAADCTFESQGAVCPQDGNLCTEHACDGAGACAATNNTDACDDGDYCTVGDQCGGGACVPGAARDCSSSGDDCNDGVCNETADACEAQPANEGGLCEDGDYCTVDDQCGSGACAAGTARDCSSAGDDCNDGACNEATDACEAQPANEGEICEDGDYCTVGDQCGSGACAAGTARDCSAADDDCNEGVCNETADACEAQPANEGGACDDGDSCSVDDECVAGACEASGLSVPPTSAKFKAKFKQGPDNDRLSLDLILPLESMGDFAAGPRVEIVIINDADDAVYTAAVPSTSFANMGDRSTHFRFKDNTGALAEANNLRAVFVRYRMSTGQLQIRAKMKGTEIPAALDASTVTLQLVLGEAAVAACVTELDVPCDGDDRNLVCKTQ